MADVFTKRKRSQIMSKIKGRGTSIETLVSNLLKTLGLKPILHYKDLPGSPDLVLIKEKVVIFTNGCFWHGHGRCKRAALPTTNTVFWRKKIRGNIERDARQIRSLRKMGWSVITFWTCKKPTQHVVLSRLKQIGLSNLKVRA
jgi:DNA mismatch endonuclease (patch repair protein)